MQLGVRPEGDVEGPRRPEDLRSAARRARATKAAAIRELARVLDDQFHPATLVDVGDHGADWDGYPSRRNNYRISPRPERSKLIFIPVRAWTKMFGDRKWDALPGFGGLRVAQVIHRDRRGRPAGTGREQLRSR